MLLVDHFLEESAARLPEKTALVIGDKRFTYCGIEADANRLAHALLEQGWLEKGARVAIVLDNSAESVLAIFATVKAGGVFITINPTIKSNKLAYLLENSRASVLITDADKLHTIASAIKSSQHLRSVIMVQNQWQDPIEAAQQVPFFGMPALLEKYADHTVLPEKKHISIDLAALIYTSGSTGDPKGVMLSHLNMVAAAASITTYLDNTKDDIILNALPMSFDYGLYQLLMGFKMGCTVVLEPSFTFYHAVMQKVVEEKVTGLPIVPTISAILLNMDLSKYDFSHLRYITNTAAALPTSHIRQLRERLPHVSIYSMYGLTECKRVSYLPPTEIDNKSDSVGIAMPGTEAYVVDDDGNRVPPGTIGELVVRGPNVMLGYWENPEATAKQLKPGMIRREEVLYTGDLFKTDSEGYLYFVGRTDDIIKSRGEKVAPKEIENVLHAHEGIKEAAVLGFADPILGQKIKAFVSLNKGSELTDKQIFYYCRQNLEDIMVPQEVEVRDTDLPKNSNGKIDKTTLKAY
jgi:amino acid adenylation domain-containing protein